MSDLPEVIEAQRVTLKPGDRLAIRVAGRLTPQDAALISERVKAAWPGVPFLILPADMTLEVVEGA